MDRGMIAFWYDLPDSGRDEYLSWLHEVHLPEVLAGREDLLWAAHFRNEGGGERFHEVVKDMMRSGKGEVEGGHDFLLLIGAKSPHSFFNPNFPQLKERQSGETKEMVGLREGLNLCVFSEEARVDGPDAALRPAGTAPGRSIQMGNFNVAKPDDDHVLGGWYAQVRLPFMEKMPGCIGARKLTAAAGWGKHSILYEFASSRARDDHFIAHEEEGFDENSWTARVHEFVIHAPCSPFVGPRLWPPVENKGS
jgi:hypothetical protein